MAFELVIENVLRVDTSDQEYVVGTNCIAIRASWCGAVLQHVAVQLSSKQGDVIYPAREVWGIDPLPHTGQGGTRA